MQHAPTTRFVRTLGTLALVGASLLCSPGALADAPTKVYCYNGGADNAGTSDGYNSGAQGWVWSQMGLLGDDGEVPTVNDADQLVLSDGTVKGSVIRGAGDPGPIIGYENNDGSQRCYNIDTDATLKDAWNAVDGNGQLIVAKHGVRYVNAGGDVVGHGVTADDGDDYPGFGPEDDDGEVGGDGTGAGGTPYGLPPRPGASIDVYLNCCYSNDDADGDGDDKRSPTDSIKDVPGVDGDNVTGNDGVIYKGPSVTGLDAAETAALVACAKANGHTVKNDDGETVGDPAGWIDTLPFPQVHSTIKECLEDAGIDDPSFGVDWEKSTEACDGGAEGVIGCGYYNPLTGVGPEGASLEFWPTADHQPAFAFLPPGVFEQSEAIFFNAVTVPEAILELIPPELAPATYFMELRRYDGQPFFMEQPATIQMHFDPGAPIVDVFRLNGPDLQFVPAFVDLDTGILQLLTHEPGIFVAIQFDEPTPQPGDLNGDGLVNAADLALLLAAWGPACPGCPEDLNNDGWVNAGDLAILLANWG